MGAAGVEVRAERVSLSVEGVRVLTDVDLRVPGGDVLGVVGDNGSGKSILLDALAGRRAPEGGAVSRRGIVAQLRQDSAYPDLVTPRQVLRLGRWAFRSWSDEDAERVAERLGLPLDREVWRLSRGMRSSIGMVLGLASGADVLLFDEPYLGIDLRTASAFGAEVRRVVAERGAAVVIATIRPDLLNGTADRVAVLVDGRVTAEAAVTPEVLESLEF